MDELSEAFEARIGALRGVVALRRCGGRAHATELRALAAQIAALEAQAAALAAALAEERRVLSAAAADVVAKAEAQRRDIAALNAALPPHMKRPPDTVAALQQTTATAATMAEPAAKKKKQKQQNARRKDGGEGEEGEGNGAGKVTEEELLAVPAYMRGRLTAERCNEALDEARRLTAARYRLLRARDTADSARREKARDLEDLARQQAGIAAGTRFFSEADIVAASGVLKLDTAGRMLLGTLRHLGRIKEFAVKGTKCWTVL